MTDSISLLSGNPILFDFLAVKTETSEQHEMSGILGLAPRSKESGPSYINYLKNAKIIANSQFSIVIDSKARPDKISSRSTVTFGGLP